MKKPLSLVFSLALGFVVMLTTGCASTGRPSPALCALIGGTAGGAGGGVIGSNNSGSDQGTDTGKGIAIGAFAGAVVGYFLCSLVPEEEPPPPPRRAAPTPPPPPPPPPPKPEPEVRQRIVLRGVNFDFNRAEIRPDAAIILDEAARLLNQEPGARVRVEGHTDWIGTEDYNQTLSERRAEAVKTYLVDHGVSVDRLSTVGYGESNPIATNETQEGRALNRRVELKVLGQ